MGLAFEQITHNTDKMYSFVNNGCCCCCLFFNGYVMLVVAGEPGTIVGSLGDVEE